MKSRKRSHPFTIKRNIFPGLCLCLSFASFPGYSQISKYPVPDTGTVTNSVYVNRYLGWQVKLPAGWGITAVEKVYQISREGAKAIDMKMAPPNDDIHLLAFQKDSTKNVPRFGSELIRIRTYPNYHITEEQFIYYIEAEILQAHDKIYHDQPVFHNGRIKIDGISFSGYTVDFKFPYYTFHQAAIVKIIRNYIFSAYWIYQNGPDGNALYESILHSKFSNVPKDSL